MNTKRDFERAARLCREATGRRAAIDTDNDCQHVLVGAFVDFFLGENPRFDAARFRAACYPHTLPPGVCMGEKGT